MKRSDVVAQIVSAVGREQLVVDEMNRGWPTIARVHTDVGPIGLALHVGPIGLSHRNRDAVERRFQNPGKDVPVSSPNGAMPLLVGIWTDEGTTVLVGLDGTSRLGHTTRQSIFVPLQLLRSAAQHGWSEHYNDAGDKITAFSPGLFATFVRTRSLGLTLDPYSVARVVEATGLPINDTPESRERGRRAVLTLVRDALFGRTVRNAYGGRCAMCGIGLGLVVGAHVLPVEAPGSPDDTTNGIALCHHHHSLFDSHRIFVHPDSRAIVVHPDLRTSASQSEAGQKLLAGTFTTLLDPISNDHRPARSMFVKRYDFYSPNYEWAREMGPLL